MHLFAVKSLYSNVQPLSLEERNLVDLELMIMEQVADWELDVGKVEAESSKSINDHGAGGGLGAGCRQGRCRVKQVN